MEYPLGLSTGLVNPVKPMTIHKKSERPQYTFRWTDCCVLQCSKCGLGIADKIFLKKQERFVLECDRCM